ncbi:MAG TPA: TetR/AcrR family transcriptional regulator [Acidimicrobiales bacterium]|nr:TetR/AcrR family transcriptional regulator [Acidimicrobiales bacterium]
MDATRDPELRRAALDLVAEIGYDRLTIDAVAARARAGKATVYRRWAGKAELVVDAFFEEMFGGLVTPDTGNLRDDLIDIASQIWLGQGSIPRAQIMAGLMSALLSDPELRDLLVPGCAAPQSVFEAVVTRAADRGEIRRPADLSVVGTVIPSMFMFRIVTTGQGPDAAFVAAVVDQVVIPALNEEAE